MFFLNTHLQATPKFKLFLEGVYALSEASFDPFDLPLPDDIPPDSRISPDYPGGTTKGAYDFSVISDYSDLDYRQLEGTLGGNYRVGKRASVYASVNLLHLTDDQPYVYGDLSGWIATYAAGMNVGF